jgi:hypothetical protein
LSAKWPLKLVPYPTISVRDFKDGISRPRESVSALYVSKLEMYSVKMPELALARYPHRPADGVDTDIVGHAREVGNHTLLYLLENTVFWGEKASSVCVLAAMTARSRARNALSQFINRVPTSQARLHPEMVALLDDWAGLEARLFIWVRLL